MLLGYARVSKKDGSQVLDLQLDALKKAGVESSVADLCNELRITHATLYRYVGPNGELREHGRQVLDVTP